MGQAPPHLSSTIDGLSEFRPSLLPKSQFETRDEIRYVSSDLGATIVDFSADDIATILGYLTSPLEDMGLAPLDVPQPVIIREIGRGHNSNGGCTYRSDLPPRLWLLDKNFKRNVFLLRHLLERIHMFQQILYAIHLGQWVHMGHAIMDVLNQAHAALTKGGSTTQHARFPLGCTISYLVHQRAPELTVDIDPITEFEEFTPAQWKKSKPKLEKAHVEIPAAPPAPDAPAHAELAPSGSTSSSFSAMQARAHFDCLGTMAEEMFTLRRLILNDIDKRLPGQAATEWQTERDQMRGLGF